MKAKRTLLLGMSVLCLTASTTGFSENSIQKSIRWIDQKIHQATQHLNSIKKNKHSLQDNLKDIEEHMSRLVQEHINTLKKLHLTHKKNLQIKQTITQTQKTLKTYQTELADLIKMEYQAGKQSNLRLALENESIQTKQRLTSYLKILNKKQTDLAQAIQNKMKDLTIQKENLEASEKNYQTMLLNIKKTQHMLEKATAHRLSIMKHMNKTIASHTEQLQVLMKQKKDLTQAIDQANQDIPVTQNLSFHYNFHHSMHWPTHGKITQNFGTRIDHSQLTTDGIVITAPIGQPVYAVANGVVVFSKWLPGYGLMMIINHGHDYMTLYGRNQQLFYHNGQVIKKGDLIATVGNTGGFQNPGLYFAVRHNGIPVNPKSYA
jgi:septal ring factor EnvC (AmiA/AmiB activator)